jgi:hypothetical protein
MGQPPSESYEHQPLVPLGVKKKDNPRATESLKGEDSAPSVHIRLCKWSKCMIGREMIWPLDTTRTGSRAPVSSRKHTSVRPDL